MFRPNRHRARPAAGFFLAHSIGSMACRASAFFAPSSASICTRLAAQVVARSPSVSAS